MSIVTGSRVDVLQRRTGGLLGDPARNLNVEARDAATPPHVRIAGLQCEGLPLHW
jgi:hypothetical protein